MFLYHPSQQHHGFLGAAGATPPTPAELSALADAIRATGVVAEPTGPTSLNLSMPKPMREFKWAMQCATTSGTPPNVVQRISDASRDSDPYWDAVTEALYVEMTASMPAGGEKTTDGHTVPTRDGVQVFVNAAANSGCPANYIAQYWPNISAWIMSGASQVPPNYGQVVAPLFAAAPPKTEAKKGASTTTLLIGAAAGGTVGFFVAGPVGAAAGAAGGALLASAVA